MARRESASGGFAKEQFSNASNSLLLLESLARLLKQELFTEVYPNEKLTEWNEKILNHSKEIARNTRRVAIAEELVTNLGKRNHQSKSEEDSLDKGFKEMKAELSSKLKSYSPDTAEHVKKIKLIIFVSCLSSNPLLLTFSSQPHEDEDEELVMLDQGDREIDFICPYTRQRMNSPLMK
jgi:hypothetical protein